MSEEVVVPYPIDDLVAYFAESKNGHEKMYAIVQSSSAIFSTISSSALLGIILRSPNRLSTSYHRLILGMTTSDILFSLSLVHFNALYPSDVGYFLWNAHGNQATCNTVGFVGVVGITASMLYGCSLNFYSLAIVKYNKTDRCIRTKIEPSLHGVPIVIALAFGISLLVTRGYNYGVSRCNTSVYRQPHCVGYDDGQVREGFEIPCGRGADGPAEGISLAGSSLLFFGAPIIVGITIGIMYRHTRRQEKRMARYGASALTSRTSQQNDDTAAAGAVGASNSLVSRFSSAVSFVRSSMSTSNQGNSMHKKVMHRSIAYSIAYFLTWTWYIVIVAMSLARAPIPPALHYLSNFFVPLQGFMNLMIFIYPNVLKAKRSQGGGEISWCQAFATALLPAGMVRKRNTSNNVTRMQKTCRMEEDKTEVQTQGQANMELESSGPALGSRHEREEEKTEIEAHQ